MSNINNLEYYIESGKLKGFSLVQFDETHFVCKLCGNIFNKSESYNNKGSWCIDCHKFDRKCKYLKNRDKIKKQVKNYDLNNKNQVKLRSKKQKSTVNYRKYQRKYVKERCKIDHMFKLSLTLRTRLISFLSRKNLNKKYKFKQYLGCTLFELKKHLELKFTEGMTWENRGKWHIDHIIPLASAKTEEELYNLCHYTNLQPLWAIDNMKKGSKISL